MSPALALVRKSFAVQSFKVAVFNKVWARTTRFQFGEDLAALVAHQQRCRALSGLHAGSETSVSSCCWALTQLLAAWSVCGALQLHGPYQVALLVRSGLLAYIPDLSFK